LEYINLEKIARESNSEVLKNLPGFVIRMMARIIKQDELNRLLTKYADYVGIDFLEKVIEEFNLTIVVEGKENLPESGKNFYAANHPFGVFDGLVLTSTVSEKYGEFKAIANDGFLFLPQMRPLVAAVNSYGSSSKEYVNALRKIYDSDIPITHFPAGKVSRIFKGKIQDPEWQKSFIGKAVSSKRNIVPFYFYGRNSRLFYSIHRLRLLFGIKLNIELMLLPREMFRRRNATIKVKIGKPIPYQMFDKTYTMQQWAQKVRAMVYDLGK